MGVNPIEMSFRKTSKNDSDTRGDANERAQPARVKNYITPGGYRRQTSRKDHRSGGSLRLAQEVW